MSSRNNISVPIVEETSTLHSEGPDQVLVQGSLLSIKYHLPLIESAFHKHKARVSYSAFDDLPKSDITEPPNASHWSIIMCLNSTGKGNDCVVTAKEKAATRVNVIPQLQKVLMSPTVLCEKQQKNDRSDHTVEGADTDTTSKGRWCGGPLPCYSLVKSEVSLTTKSHHRSDHQETLSRVWCHGSDGVWLASATSGAGMKPVANSFMSCKDGDWQDPILAKEQLRQAPRDSVLVPIPSSLVTLDGRSPLAWQVKVLVTSLQPAARVYIHPSGLIYEGLTPSVSQRHQKVLSMTELYQLISDLNPEQKSHFLLNDLHLAIMKVLQLAEKHLIVNGEMSDLHTPKSFQLFDVVLVFNSSFYPYIIEILPCTYSEGLSSLSSYLQEQNILEDLVTILLTREKTASYIHNALLSLGFNTFSAGMPCVHPSGPCLSAEFLSFLLDVRKEQAASQNWRRLSPNTVQACSRHAVNHLKIHLDSNSTYEYIALLIEMLLMCPSNVILNKGNFSYPHSNIPRNEENLLLGEIHAAKTSLETKFLERQPCTTDPSSLSYLSAIRTQPYLQLYPEFSPLNFEYQAWADYNTMLVYLQGLPAHCQAKAKLEYIDDGESPGSGNLSLGLGKNIIYILVEHSGQRKPTGLATYTVTIHRLMAADAFQNIHNKTGIKNGQALQVCSLKQDCSLPYLPAAECGLKEWNPDKHYDGQKMQLPLNTWDHFQEYHATLPKCQNDNAYDTGDARWMVPCYSCSDMTSCTWKDAIWYQDSCQEIALTHTQIQECFSQKQVLFIGDSTNRGIMNYITKRLNETLLEWDKTHTVRVYSGLNQGRTVFGFAYYPQFWLNADQRPPFDVAFAKLRDRSKTLVPNQWETLLVLGGVHWLTKHHLQSLQARLKRDGLRNVKIVVKGLGAGFHQPVTGIHQLSLIDQQKMYYKNKELLRYSRSQGYLTVDTFPMTMARFKDFLQGKCACHFHKVSAEHPSVLSKLLPNATYQALPFHVQYRVQGEINAAYSEMVINRICHAWGRS
ncbi:cadherin-like and pc-esterase domain-containing protein 1 [Plakobranchus ocellatus]|uniref:Cadherin-like and pc-esterase domain-containing protein 1 n=1 Tax=Plakobranchus ocellatus TaxID=259542 RepID=A0AAV4C8P5_9GAST|nr:cadherin-like and pc-esterase domain-containing protein 1 [Plakobranchus ocellatus]